MKRTFVALVPALTLAGVFPLMAGAAQTSSAVAKPTDKPAAKAEGAKTEATKAASTQAVQAPAEPKIKVGDMAPDFKLLDQNGKPVQLSDFRGKKNIALGFYIFAFTGG